MAFQNILIVVLTENGSKLCTQTFNSQNVHQKALILQILVFAVAKAKAKFF